MLLLGRERAWELIGERCVPWSLLLFLWCHQLYDKHSHKQQRTSLASGFTRTILPSTDFGTLATHCHRGWGSSSYPHSRGTTGASEVEVGWN